MWREIDNYFAWAPFDERFTFRANLHEQERPAIRFSEDCLVLGDVFAHDVPGVAAGATWG